MRNYGLTQPEITFVNGRAYRNEALERDEYHRSMTQEERQILVERHFERAELRQIEADLNLLKAVELGKALQQLKEG
ncbi:hypothetical protein [Sinorhizobium fredii]|uniref:hypothetical protein n=1 Tax=Rhizobium fredii TaxID=380 RepID=UPI003516766F